MFLNKKWFSKICKRKKKVLEVEKNISRKKEIVERGFNQEIYNNVNKMIKFSGEYVKNNWGKIIEEIISQGNKDKRKIYQNLLKIVNQEIDKIEKKCEITSICKRGCAACCYQAIYISKTEADFIAQEIKNMSEMEKRQVKEQTKKVLLQAEKNNIPLKLQYSDDEKENNLKYLRLNLKCPLLNEQSECMVYDIRPQVCYVYRNYGVSVDCEGKIAPHSYNFQEYNIISEAIMLIINEQPLIGKSLKTPVFMLLAKYIYDEL